jgi:hypothetical protein
MPTNELEQQFFRDYARLTPAQRAAFKAAVKEFVDDPGHGRHFRPALRVKGVQGHPGIYEITWEMPDGRATFAFGQPRVPGHAHIVWRRIGGHEIFKRP